MCPACADKSGNFSPFHSIVYVHPPRLLMDFNNSKWSSLTWLAYFLSHDYFSYINLHVFFSFSFLFLSDESPRLESLDFTIRITSKTNLFIFRFVSLRADTTFILQYNLKVNISLFLTCIKWSPEILLIHFYLL